MSAADLQANENLKDAIEKMPKSEHDFILGMIYGATLREKGVQNASRSNEGHTN